MKVDKKRIGLRVHEIEASLAANIDPYSAELVEYVNTREIGRAARLAMLIRGMDVIKDKSHLARIATSELKIDPTSFENVIRILKDAGLLRDGNVGGREVWVENVSQVDFGSNYERLGEIWLLKKPSAKERASIFLLNRLIDMPSSLDDIPELGELSGLDRKRVIEVAVNACFVDRIRLEKGRYLYYTPVLWDVDPKRLQDFLIKHGNSALSTMVKNVSGQQGFDVTGKIGDPLINDAIRSGVLPSHTIKSMGGPRTYSFTPYTGRMATTTEEREILNRARAIVACLKYGSEAAVITRIRNKRVILSRLLDEGHGYRIGPHSEIKDQYGILVTKGVGKVRKSGSRYFFELIPSDENVRAGKVAEDFLASGKSTPEAAIDLPDGARILSLSGEMSSSEKEIQIARQRKRATSDELEELVESIRST
jgi:hypothetical protein